MLRRPELVPRIGALPPFSDPHEGIEATRERFRALLAARPADRSGVRSKRYDVPRPDGSALSIEVCHPETGEGPAPTGPLPTVLHFHGGGYALVRSLPGQDRTALPLCRELPAVTIVVEYRLAPEHRHPAGVDDCYLTLERTAAHAAERGIDPEHNPPAPTQQRSAGAASRCAVSRPLPLPQGAARHPPEAGRA
ncbi:alpha/beta hydrolase [Streptomyces sp. NPDC058000]|uniref:alpha/beta hydrolase n=1 Tax=Streptomyces sp. NPDC058000 TaxID=3346299 RepID=UPI0036ED0B17